jgi:hypothetical protein
MRLCHYGTELLAKARGFLANNSNSHNVEKTQAEQQVSVDCDESSDALYHLAPEAMILELDTSLPGQMYQILLKDRRIQTNEKSLALLNYLRDPRSEKEIEAFLGVASGSGSPNQLIRRFLDISIEKGVLLSKSSATDGSGTSSAPLSKSKGKRYPFFVYKNLFSQEVLRPLTSRLNSLFTGPGMALCGLLIVLSHGAVLVEKYIFSSGTPSVLNSLSAQEWICLFVISIFGLFFHELGHSSACTRHGCTHGDIGVGIYFIYPVFFADVTDAWSLPRLKRLAVDLGGMYFHLIFSSICCLLWLVTHAPVFLITIYSILLMVMFNLNPFLRFDGYWALVDLTGIPRLNQTTGQICRWLWNRLKGTAHLYSKPDFMGVPLGIRITVIIYAAGTTVFLLYFMRYLILIFLPWMITVWPKLLFELWAMAANGEFGAKFWKDVLQTIFLGASCWGIGLLVIRVSGYLVKSVKSYFRNGRRLAFNRTGTG